MTELGNMGRVLVVDDDQGIVSALKRTLEPGGYRVTTACSGREALGKFPGAAFEVAVLDYQMPEMNGVELAGRLRIICPTMVRILLTSEQDFGIAQEAINRAGVYRYLVKPWDPPNLRVEIALAVSEAKRLQAKKTSPGEAAIGSLGR